MRITLTKRCAALLLALVFALLAGCSGAQRPESSAAAGPEGSAADGGQPAESAPAKTLLEHGQELVALMGEMAASGAYIGLYTASTDIGDILSAAGEGDFSSPTAVCRVQFSESALGQLLEFTGLMDDLDGLSQPLREAVRARSVSALPTMLNGMGGADVLAAASVCTAGKTFRSDEVPGNGLIYLYLYEDAVPAAVTFLPGEDGTASASGMLILYDGFRPESLDDLSALLGELGAEVSKVIG